MFKRNSRDYKSSSWQSARWYTECCIHHRATECRFLFTRTLSTHRPIQWSPFSLLLHPGQQTEDPLFQSGLSAQGSPKLHTGSGKVFVVSKVLRSSYYTLTTDLVRNLKNRTNNKQLLSPCSMYRQNVLVSTSNLCLCLSSTYATSPYSFSRTMKCESSETQQSSRRPPLI